MEKEVLETIKKYNMLSNNDKVVVAVSGGPDSMALLNILYNLKNELNIELYVAHVNHMIRSVADSETAYVKQFCEDRSIKCYIKKIDVLKRAELDKISTEEAGRNVRYDFFEEVYKKINADKIAIAHNANDNAETILMNIIRGTGISGLKGIEPVRADKYIRPLIETKRAEIEEYCKNKELNPKYDESNYENIYTRNKIRNLLIPYIKEEFNPNIIESLNKLSNLAMVENKYIDKLVLKEYEKIVKKDFNNESTNQEIILNLKEFNILDNFMKNKIIMYSVFKLFGTTKGIEKKHIEDIVKLCSRNIGNKFLTPNKKIKIFVGKGEIIISKIM